MLDAWDESPLYSDRERAALTWAEACTNLREGHVSDEVYEAVSKQFDEKGISDLTFVVAAINAWNRLAIPGRATPGKYKSALKSAASQCIVRHRGTISHQHGVGTDHAPYLHAEKSELGIELLRSTFVSVDPRQLFNPGKLLPDTGPH